MAASRIARLTLFSGSQCSLCEVGIVQCEKMSSYEHKCPDCQGRTSQSQETASVRPGNHQHPGKRPGKVDEEICLLDTRPASRRDGDSQGPLGCLHSARGIEATGGKTPVREIDGIIDGPNDSFIADTVPAIYPSAQFLSYSCLYDRIPGVALGEEKDELITTSPSQDLRLCFNCGSPNHAVTSCPEFINRQLVSLSRQLFDFLHPDLGKQEFTRFYITEGRKQQRLKWLKCYEPGVIRGPRLRDALGLQDGDPGSEVEWLRNMAYWGYPPGWVGRRNPVELVCHRILEGEVEEQVATTECNLFTIFEGADDDEEIDLRLFRPKSPSAVTSVDEERTRWATYPDTHFSSAALSIYNGIPLDRVPPSPSRVSVTFTPERMALWERILSGDSSLGTDNILPVLPWRILGAFGASSCLALEGAIGDLTPRPPSTTPPPLPLTPSSLLYTSDAQSSVPNIESTPSFISEGAIDIADDRSVVDMDVSE